MKRVNFGPAFGTYTVKKIVHISDTHIRLVKRHEEYRAVFKTLYNDIIRTCGVGCPDTAIIFTGDLFHTKIELSPEAITLASEFLRALAEIAPTFVIAGNHDMNLANKHRMDSLSPIVSNINSDNLFYLRESGIYTIGDTDIGVFSIIGDESEWPHSSDCSSENKIALCHAPINDATTDTGFTITDRHMDISLFDGYDMVMMGDIHKMQVLQDYDLHENKPLIAYCGSLIQQNHGEKLSGHGWLEWNIPQRTFKYHELQNEYGYATVTVENGVMSDLGHVPSKPRLRVFTEDLETSKVRKIETVLRTKFDVQEFVVSKLRNTGPGMVHRRKALNIIDVSDVETQNGLIREYLTRKHPESVRVMADILKINVRLNSNIKTEVHPVAIQWRPLLFEFSNMFSYGEDNVIHFKDMQGSYGLFSPNAYGKTAVFDSLMFCLYDKTPRAFKAANIMNNRKNKFECYLKFEIDNVEYGIRRKGRRDSKGNVSVKVDFWCINDQGEKVSLNGEERRATNLVIRNYVGTYEDFILTSLSLQNNNAIFIDKTQSERKDLLGQFLGVNIFEALHELASDETKEAAGALKNLSKTDFSEELVKIQGDIDRVQDKYTEISTRLEESHVLLEHVDGQRSILHDRKIPVEGDSLDIDNLKAVYQLTHQNLSFLSDSIQELQQTQETQRETSGSLVGKLNEFHGVDEEYLELSAKVQALSSVQIEIESISKQIQSSQTQLDHLASHEYDPDCEYCVRSNQTVVNTSAEITVNIGHSVEQLDHLEPKMVEYTETMRRVPVVTARFKEAHEIQHDLEVADKGMLRSAAAIGEAQTKIAALKINLQDIKVKVERYNESVDIIERNKAIERNLTTLDQQHHEISEVIIAREEQIKLAHGVLEVAKSKKQQILNQMVEMEELERSLRAHQFYLEAVKRDGIPYEMISKLIPALEDEVNNLLTQVVGFTVVLQMDGKNINGRIVYDSDRHWPIEMSSGMERFIGSLAIRAALITSSNLPKPNFIILDEGFGALSTENLLNMQIIFQILKDQFDFIIVISHLETMRDFVDNLMEIKKENGYSKINY